LTIFNFNFLQSLSIIFKECSRSLQFNFNSHELELDQWRNHFPCFITWCWKR